MADHIETPLILDCRLRVEFLRQPDRFGHVVHLIEGKNARPLLVSVEGTTADLWPPSPVLQHLHIEDREHASSQESRQSAVRQVALLVGMAGRSHWSLSVEPELSREAALVFDVACRVQPGVSAELRSSYQPQILPKRVEAKRSVLAVSDSWLITLGVVDLPEQLSAGTLQSNSSGLSISPEPTSSPTWRWKYRVELTRAGEDTRMR